MAAVYEPGRAQPRHRLAIAAGAALISLLAASVPASTLAVTLAAEAGAQAAPQAGTDPTAAGTPNLDHPMATTNEPVSSHVVPEPGADPASWETSTLGATTVASSPDEPAPPRHASAVGLESFVALGFTWSGEPSDATGRVRVRRNGDWSDWQAVSGEDRVGGDGPTEDTDGATEGEGVASTAPARTTSEPIWVGGADGWEAELPAAWGDPTIHLVRPTIGPSPEAVGPPDGDTTAATGGDLANAEDLGVAGTGVDPPEVHSRAEWGARPPTSTPWVMAEVRGAIVHHSVTDVTYQPGDVPAMLRAIQAFHQDANGWTDIGYNFAVDRFGRVWEGRAGGAYRAVLGAHTEGFNSRTVGVVLLGDFSVAAPTPAALAGLEDVLAWKLFLHHTDPGLPTTLLDRSGTPAGLDIFNVPSIVGHRDLNATACPGTVEDYLPAIRATVAARVAAANGSGTNHEERAGPTAPPDATPLVGDFDGDGASDVYWYGNGHGDQLWYGGDGGLQVVPAPALVPAGMIGVVGDFDGDGRSDLFWHDPTLAADGWWYGRPGRTWEGRADSTVARTTPFVGDFDGNGADDVLLYGGANHDDFLMLMSHAGRGSRWVDVPDDIVPVIGDFDGDTRSDVVLHHPWGGVDEVRFGADDAIFTARIVPSPTSDGARRPLVGDLDADHADDIVWLDGPAAGTVEYGRSFAEGQAPVGGAGLAAVADVTGGGTADLITAGGYGGGSLSVAGTDRSLRTTPIDAPPADHLLVLDLDRDGRRDVVWARADQPTILWLMR